MSLNIIRNLCMGFAVVSVVGAYVVRNGDNLWDLSKAELKDPFRWGEIWQANPQIQNPNLIFPGEEIKFPNGASAGQSGGTSAQARYSNDLDADFADRLGALANDPDHHVKPIERPKSKLSNNISQLDWIDRRLQLLSPRWVLPVNETKTFDLQFRALAIGRVLEKSAIVQNGDEFELAINKSSDLNVGQVLELFEDNEPTALVYKDSQKPIELLVHSTSAFARVTEVDELKAKIKVFGLIKELHTEKVAARVNPIRMPVQVKNYSMVDTLDLSKAAKVAYVSLAKAWTVSGDWVMLNRGVNEGFDVGDAVGIWKSADSTKGGIHPILIAQGIVVNSNAYGAAIFVKKVVSTEIGLTEVGDLALVYAKAQTSVH